MHGKENAMIAELVKANRSCRRFEERHGVPMDILRALTDLGRLSASAANLQPLKYILCCNRSMNAKIFACLSWARYLEDWPGPAEGERPAAYIVMLHDRSVSRHIDCDHGISAQSILLGAREMGLAGCMLGAVDRKTLRSLLGIGEDLKIILVLAIGKPKERVVIETLETPGDIRYWRDADGAHHVPKRSLAQLLLAEYDLESDPSE
jgi:nitroreductase